MKMDRTKYKAVIFDLGGVLVTDIWEPLRDWLAVRYGLARPDLEKFGKDVVWGKEFACTRNHTQETDLYQQLIRDFKIKASPDELIEKADQFLEPIAGMKELLGDLKKHGTTLGICSNNTEFWYARQRDALDLETFVDPACIKLSCRVGEKKPESKIILEAVKATGEDPATCVFIDDRTKNVLKAIDLGLTGIHVLEPSASDRPSRYLRRLLVGLGVLPSGA
jgi:putative hydrolase of the HAD superfamily